MKEPGFDRILRHALRSELMLRLRHALLHELKGPSQTIISALHLLRKRVGAGQIEELPKYADWIADAAREFAERADRLLPSDDSANVPCDLRSLTEEALHRLRDEAALHAIGFEFSAVEEAATLRGSRSELSLALLAILASALDAASEGSRIAVSLTASDTQLHWTMTTPGSTAPPADIFEPRFDLPAPQSGIAWPVARSIIAEHGGALTIDAQGQSWRACISLPRA